MMNDDFTPWPENVSKRYKELGYWQDKTLFDHLYKTVMSSPDAPAICCGEITYNYQDFLDRIYK
ncbi:2,3-dihydroxybenzoate-AMP ligase, partial [Vibrio kanaloae]